MIDFLSKALVIGLSDQAPLVLAAIGLALIYYLSKVINVAFAETITLGAYFGMWFNTTFGLNFYASLVLAGILAGLLSVATYLVVFRPASIRKVGTVEVIIISFGLSVFLRHALQFVFGYEARFFDVPTPTYTEVLDVGVTTFQITAVALVIAAALGLYFFVQKTNYGQQIRALASDESLAQVSGINPLVVTLMIWFIAGTAGGLAGTFWGVSAAARPDLGWQRFLLVLLVVLVGGSWGIRGVIIAGLGTGVLLSGLKLEIPPLRAEIALLVVFIVILKLRGDRSDQAARV